jgi:hypothetical protein
MSFNEEMFDSEIFIESDTKLSIVSFSFKNENVKLLYIQFLISDGLLNHDV